MKTLEVQEVEVTPQTAVVRHNGEQPEPRGITPAQAKTDAIAALTMKAYEKASQLLLTPEEVKGLAAEFPDEAFKPGAAGKEHLIYIEHAFLRDRLNSVFGPGQWALIPRNRWAEEFVLPARRDKPETHGSRIYVEAMLMIRGCFVSESVGAMEYYPSNNSQNYGDAVEGAKTAALRRCCKELGIGLQAWKKDFGDGWWQRQRSGQRNSNTRGMNTLGASQTNTRVASEPPISRQATNTARTEADAKARTVPPTGECATIAQRDKMLQSLLDTYQDQNFILEYARKAAILLPQVETLADWPRRFVPTTQRQMDLLVAAIKDFSEGREAVKPFVNPDPPEEKKVKQGQTESKVTVQGASWRQVEVLFGKNRGKTLGELERNSLAWYCRNHEVTETYTNKTTGKEVVKTQQQMAKDTEFRRALDGAMAELGITSEGGEQ
jgi:hypothetical protein